MEFVKPIDNHFALENYHYVTEELKNKDIKQIYELLGPTPLYKYTGPVFPSYLTEAQIKQQIEEIEDNREMIEKFVQRKSGAMYKGQAHIMTGRPDGMGIKIFKGQSLYEGWF